MVINSDYINCERKIAFDIATFLLDCKVKPVVLCVGCDRITGDSLAPMVGELLTHKYNLPAFVYGNLDHNITAQNLSETVQKIKLWHEDSPIIVVDAVLGDEGEVGQIKYYKGGCYPAGAFNKFAGLIGDYSLLGVVESTGISKHTFLASVKLKIVTTLAEKISKAIALGFQYNSALNSCVKI